MYHLYHTDAFVLGGMPSGEGSKTIALFTRELGFLTASAQSVREERSKLRYGLQDFSYVAITLVRGKEFWRLTRADLIENIVQEHSKKAIRMVARIVSLLRRLLVGEEKNEALFVAVLDGFRYIKDAKREDVIEGVEIVLALRILYFLGYLAPRGEFAPFLSHAGLWDETVISQAILFRTLAVSEINNSLQQSQL